MASVDLHLHEVEDGWMPPVCAVCSDQGDCVRAKTVVWSPWWVPLVAMVGGFIIFFPFVRLLFGALAGLSDTNRRVTLHLPFCERHRNHWRWRSWPTAATLIASLSLIAGAIVVIVQATDADSKWTGVVLGAGGLAGLVVWAILMLVLPFTAIRISDVAGTALTLSGVDPSFCNADAQRRHEKSSSISAPFESSDYDDRLRARRELRFRETDDDDE